MRSRLEQYILFRLVSYRSQTGNLMSILERRAADRKRDRGGALVIKTPLQIDVNFGPSEIIPLSDAREAARLKSTKDENNEDDALRGSSDEYQDEAGEEQD